ncbi:MAG: FG-GAP-like repeat-containing protein [Planctomycetota bacterium]
MHPLLSPFWGAVLAASLPLTASAQQFQQVPAAIPGPANWSEGVEPADVDNDGDLDLFIADGGGFQSPGIQYQNLLLINLLESAPLTFADESVTRLGMHVSHAKGVTTGDVQGDGWVDAIFCNAFGTDAPFLYVNLGAASPGFFTFEGAARGLDSVLSSGSAQLGDVDNDGDLDLVLNDGYFVGGSLKPRLYLNDGEGFFSEDTDLQVAAPAKGSHMDVQLVDFDNDWDLDLFGANRQSNPGGNHFLLLNDGAGKFSDSSGFVVDGTSAVYEVDAGDLDGDTDIDLFYISLASAGFSFNEGPARNNLIETTALSFTPGAASGGSDDNEVALIDYDVDGDLDAFIGSLGPTERMHANNGAGAFSVAAGVIQAINDSTLDCTAADLDNDGDYDLVTVQGESGAAQWENKVFENTGAADTLAPVVLREEELATTAPNGPWVVRASVQDQVLDDGRSWVAGEVRYTLNTAPLDDAASIAGSVWSPAVLSVAAGTTVTFTNNDLVDQSVTSTTPGYGFDSGALAPGETFDVTFVQPGTYDYVSTLDALMPAGQVQVTGTATVGGTISTGTLYRHEMVDVAACQGVELTYELAYSDWAGNLTVTPARRVALDPVICGVSQFGLAAGPANTIDLGAGGSTSLGTTFEAIATNLPLGTTGAFFVASRAKLTFPLLGAVGLVDPTAIIDFFVVPAAGEVSTFQVPIPVNPQLCGFEINFQCAALDASQPEGFAFSNGVELLPCP